MSADNGIYILSTPTSTETRQYRVAHLQAIEDLYWDGSGDSTDPRIHIINARRMWANAPVFTDKRDALGEAMAMAHDTPILEYGIQEIELEIPFEEGTYLEPFGGVLLTRYDIGMLRSLITYGYVTAIDAEDIKRIIKCAEEESAEFLLAKRNLEDALSYA